MKEPNLEEYDNEKNYKIPQKKYKNPYEYVIEHINRRSLEDLKALCILLQGSKKVEEVKAGKSNI